MNWEMLAAVGQLAAVLLGVPSVIYLAVQIRAQTRERHQSAMNALTVRWADLAKSLHDNPEFSAIYLRGLQFFTDLDPTSKLKFSAFFFTFFQTFQGMYLSHQDGLLRPSLWAQTERTMMDLLSYPGARQWWETRRHWYTEEFASVVDEIIAKGGEPKAYATYSLGSMPSS
jgi:hypothetical protein